MKWVLFKLAKCQLDTITVKEAILINHRSAFYFTRIVRSTFLGVPYSYMVIETETEINLRHVIDKQIATNNGFFSILFRAR